MLPFLSARKAGSVLVARKKPTEPDARPEIPKELMNIAHDLIVAVQNNDVKGVAQALEDAWSISEAGEPEPSEGEE